MEKSEYLILEGDDIAERVVGDSHNLEMTHSYSEIWTEHTKGEFIAKLKDTGNGVNIKINDKKIKLDYAEFCYLFNLISIKMLEDNNMLATTEIIKKSGE